MIECLTIPKETHKKPTEGWVFIYGAKKWHYIINKDPRSLCKKWMYLGNATPEEGNNESKDNCTACLKKLLNRNNHVKSSIS